MFTEYFLDEIKITVQHNCKLTTSGKLFLDILICFKSDAPLAKPFQQFYLLMHCNVHLRLCTETFLFKHNKIQTTKKKSRANGVDSSSTTSLKAKTRKGCLKQSHTCSYSISSIGEALQTGKHTRVGPQFASLD
jgi:hypothetical protein